MAGIILTDVAKEYPTRGEPLSILRELNWRLEPGQNAAILGPSGAGKSTLLYLLGTLESPTRGQVQILGKDPSQLDEAALAHFRNTQIGFVFQEHYLLPQCSVLENILLPALAQGTVTDDLARRGRELAERVGLTDRLTHRPRELSGGERQRVAIARALLLRPRLLLADEPTGNLDRHTAAAISRLLLELQAVEQAMLVIVTHSLDLARLCQRRYELNDGRLLEMGLAVTTEENR
ncbi:MAG: ABC transporter ATP-binding protein [Pirellulales bacterium]|nr:ABC transporter ATP-binding protein [Pirellulales bacterium]